MNHTDAIRRSFKLLALCIANVELCSDAQTKIKGSLCSGNTHASCGAVNERGEFVSSDFEDQLLHSVEMMRATLLQTGVLCNAKRVTDDRASGEIGVVSCQGNENAWIC